MLRSLVFVVLLAACTLVPDALTGVGAQELYPAHAGPLTESVGTIPVGGSLQVSGSGYAPGATVTITLESTPVTLTATKANGAGAFQTSVVIPASTAPGAHKIVATGEAPDGGTLTLTGDLTVTSAVAAIPPSAAPAAAPGALPHTGSAPLPFALIGVVFVMLGIAIITWRRRSAVTR
jgi:LPXTG-motif cell wall-anchored protein